MLDTEPQKQINNFSNWKKWKDRNKLDGLIYPGIYAIAYSEQDISDNPFNWIKGIIYIGMTNSRGGLKSRLQQFDDTIRGGIGHGGAQRVRYKHKNYSKLIENLFVSVDWFKCDVTSNKVEDLSKMGEVAQSEYICFAEYVKQYGCLPEFNDKKRSPKDK